MLNYVFLNLHIIVVVAKGFGRIFPTIRNGNQIIRVNIYVLPSPAFVALLAIPFHYSIDVELSPNFHTIIGSFGGNRIFMTEESI